MDSYILGLIASDGFTSCYTCKDGTKTYNSKLEMSEEQIIKDICNIYKKPIKHRKRTIANKEREFWSVSFPNKDIGKYGKYLVKGRPNIKELYDSFDEYNKIEFLRGVFDGDGSIVVGTKSNPYRRTIGFSVNGTQQDMKEIIEDFAKTHNLHLSIYFDNRRNGSWYLSFNGRDSLERIYYLFFNKHCDIKNLRKYKIFSNINLKECANE